MYEAIFLLIGVFFGAVLGRRISVVERKKSPWQRLKILLRRFFGLDGGKFDGGTGQTCVYFCNETKLSQTCDEGAEASGKCLDNLNDKCTNNEPIV